MKQVISLQSPSKLIVTADSMRLHLAGLVAALALCASLPAAGGATPCDLWTAELSPSNTIAPNSTVPDPVPSTAAGLFSLCLREDDDLAGWGLVLCDVTSYTTAELHIGRCSVRRGKRRL